MSLVVATQQRKNSLQMNSLTTSSTTPWSQWPRRNANTSAPAGQAAMRFAKMKLSCSAEKVAFPPTSFNLARPFNFKHMGNLPWRACVLCYQAMFCLRTPPLRSWTACWPASGQLVGSPQKRLQWPSPPAPHTLTLNHIFWNLARAYSLTPELLFACRRRLGAATHFVVYVGLRPPLRELRWTGCPGHLEPPRCTPNGTAKLYLSIAPNGHRKLRDVPSILAPVRLDGPKKT